MTATLFDDGPLPKPILYALASTVSLSRVHVRMHHGSDVLAGALIGTALGRLAKRIWQVS